MTLEVGGAPLRLDLRPGQLDRFRNVAAILKEQGFTVVPIPLVPAAEPFVFLGYNNILMETRAGERHVYLPCYGVEALDAAAIAAWEGLGARVHPIRCDRIFRLGGTIRCLAVPLARGG